MPREIKFRGFDLDIKKWVYGGYHKHIKRQVSPFGDQLKEEDIQHLIILDGFADWNMPRPLQVATNIDESSIGQYTGLKDKNGVEIYEGDIVKTLGYHHSTPHEVKEELFVVVWSFTHWVLQRKLKTGGVVETLLGDEDDEVIGNIYENKELLENA